MATWFAVAAVCTVGLAACGGGGSGGDSTVSLGSPQEIVEAVNLDGVHSGQLDVVFKAGIAEDYAQVRVTGPFKGLGEGGLPQFGLTVSSQGRVDGREVDFNGSMGAMPDRLVFVYGPTFREVAYKADRGTFEEFEGKFEEAQEEGGEADITACLQAVEGVGLTGLVRNLEKQGRLEDFDGTTVWAVAGDLDVAGAIDVLVQMREDEDCGAQMEAFGLPSVGQLKAAKAASTGKSVPLTLDVDKHGSLHDLRVNGRLKTSSASQAKAISFEVVFSLNQINKDVELFVEQDGAPLAKLLRKLGLDIEAVRRLGGRELVLGLLEGVVRGATGQLP
jgi:hypothetical protein